MSFDAPLPPYNASDPHARFLNVSCLDLLLIELVPLAERMARHVSAGMSSSPNGGEGRGGAGEVGTDGGTATGGVGDGEDEERVRDAMYWRLDALGYRVGLGLSERFSRDRPLFTEPLDVIKFLCKDLWTIVFKKQIDNLKTNHRGVYVLTDNLFRPFSRMSTTVRGEAIQRAQPYLWFPCGVLRGALASLGIKASVQAETNDLPGAAFQIKTLGSTLKG
ncbi:MAG: hypothetical protein Q9160_000749 [Pyrenula sp. 1 TL-2023]